MIKRIGQMLWEGLRPRGPRKVPISRLTHALHGLATALAGHHPDKGRLRAHWHDGEYYDADLAQKLVDAGTITTTKMRIRPVAYAGLTWGVSFSNSILSQGEGSNADLIWVISMPPERARKPVLFFEEPEEAGPKVLDGSHRIIRAVVDGLDTMDVDYNYGEPGDDWLGLDLRRVNTPTRNLSRNIVVGAIDLSLESSGGLNEKTNREGFVENGAYTRFKQIILGAISLLEVERKIDKDNIRRLTTGGRDAEVEKIKRPLVPIAPSTYHARPVRAAGGAAAAQRPDGRHLRVREELQESGGRRGWADVKRCDAARRRGR